MNLAASIFRKSEINMRYPFIRSRFIAISMTALLSMQLGVASATASGSNFDIPISELNKVKKKTPAKREVTETRKKKKKVVKQEESPVKTAVQGEPAAQKVSSLPEAGAEVKSEPVNQQSQDAGQQRSEAESIQINHSPYSFVVAGKRTVLHAVINSKTDIREVNCAVNRPEGGAPSQVKMTKVSGTRFTYTATLPALSPETPSLRYTIVAVDSLGNELRSQEYVTPLTSSPVVPGWQLENTAEAVPVEQKLPAK